MKHLDTLILSLAIKEASARPPGMSSGSRGGGDSLMGNAGLFRGGLMGGKGGIPAPLVRGAQYSKLLTSAFAPPKNPHKIPNLQQTMRIMKLKGGGGAGVSQLGQRTLLGMQMRNGVMPEVR